MTEDTKKEDLEKIKELMKSYSLFMKNLADFYTGIGNLEESNPQFKEFYQKSLNIDFLKETMERMPEDMAKQFSNILFDFVLLSSTKKMDNLTSEEKKDVGQRLKKMSESFSELIEKTNNKEG